MSGRKVNIAADDSNVSADRRGVLDLRIAADNADVAANTSVPGKFSVAADNDKVSADLPFQGQVVAYDEQVSRDAFVLTDPPYHRPGRPCCSAQSCHWVRSAHFRTA